MLRLNGFIFALVFLAQNVAQFLHRQADAGLNGSERLL
jgi:hypothetical protein